MEVAPAVNGSKVMLQVGTFDLKSSYGIIPCKNTEYVSALGVKSVEISSMLFFRK